MVQAWVHGVRRFLRSLLHVADFAIVIISLGLEITALIAAEGAFEVGGLLVVFRLWRVVRVMQAVREVQHKRAHEQIGNLKEANKKLFEYHKAHHAVIKGLHHEFVQRVCFKAQTMRGLCASLQAHHALAGRSTHVTLNRSICIDRCSSLC